MTAPYLCCSCTTTVPSCRLEYRGPNFQNPGIMDVLRRLPYLASAPEALLLWLRAYGELRSYQPAQCIIPRRVRMDWRLEGQVMVFLGLSLLHPFNHTWLAAKTTRAHQHNGAQGGVVSRHVGVHNMPLPSAPCPAPVCLSLLLVSPSTPARPVCSSCCLAWCGWMSSGLARSRRAALWAWAAAWGSCPVCWGTTCLAWASWARMRRSVTYRVRLRHGCAGLARLLPLL